VEGHLLELIEGLEGNFCVPIIHYAASRLARQVNELYGPHIFDDLPSCLATEHVQVLD